ncbi:hypothetical protein BHE74_00013991 [Ensete ventricosum]|nr:hypothetical protein BHE74_00013991 [Ensete ventricosum]
MNRLESSIRKIKEILEIGLPKEKPFVRARCREDDTGVEEDKGGARDHKWKSAVWDPSRCKGYIGARDNHDLDPTVWFGFGHSHRPDHIEPHRKPVRPLDRYPQLRPANIANESDGRDLADGGNWRARSFDSGPTFLRRSRRTISFSLTGNLGFTSGVGCRLWNIYTGREEADSELLFFLCSFSPRINPVLVFFLERRQLLLEILCIAVRAFAAPLSVLVLIRQLFGCNLCVVEEDPAGRNLLYNSEKIGSFWLLTERLCSSIEDFGIFSDSLELNGRRRLESAPLIFG